MSEFLGTVRETIEKHRMLRRGSRVLVGVSGGPDSLALLTALVALRQERGLTLLAAYVDHGLRPKASLHREADLVRKVGRMWNVPVRILHRLVRKKAGESLEASAREVRYEGLLSLARRMRCQAIAVGHTRDDQAETILMWILRGTGTTGLAGIPPVREGDSPRIIRPLIDCSRADVEMYLKANGLRALEDRSNRSPRFLRNRIRHGLIPLLEREYSPQIRERLANLAEILREDLGWMKEQVTDRFRQVARVRGDSIQLNRRMLKGEPTTLRRAILQHAVDRLQGNRHGFRTFHWLSLDRLLFNGSSGCLDLPHRIRAEADKDWVGLYTVV